MDLVIVEGSPVKMHAIMKMASLIRVPNSVGAKVTFPSPWFLAKHFVDTSSLSFGESARVYHAWGLQKAYILFHQWFWRRFQLPKRFGERFYTFSQRVLANSLLPFAKAFGETTYSLAL